MSGDIIAATIAHGIAMTDDITAATIVGATAIAHETDIIAGTAAAIGAIGGSHPPSMPGDVGHALVPESRA
jgi:hypothetical protein